jgi:hypothetical protein
MDNMSSIDKAQSVAPVIERAAELTSQSRAREGNFSNIWVVNHLARAGLVLAPWWSTVRDNQLRNFWKGSDHLSGALYAMISRMSAIPYVVKPRDRSIKNYVSSAEQTKRVLDDSVEFGGGWISMYSSFVEDLLCLAGTTRVHLGGDRLGKTKSIRDIVKDKDAGPVLSIDSRGNIVEKNINQWHVSPLGNRRWWWISTDKTSGHSGNNRGGVFMTEDHPVLSEHGWLPARDIIAGMKVATGDPVPSEDQMKIIIGGLLGDMSIGKIRNRSILRFTQGAKQEEWLDRKIDSLSGFRWTGRRTTKIKTDKGNDSEFIGVNSRASAGLNDLRDRWYPNGRISLCREDVDRYFSPLMMSVWFCDDGSLQRNYTKAGSETSPSAYLYTNNFSEKDVEWLVGYLSRKGFRCKLYKSDIKQKESCYIYVTADGTKKLMEYIGKYVPTCMRYKLSQDAPEYDSSLWEAGTATPYYDTVVQSHERNYYSGHSVCKTTYHIGVEETRNFIAANLAVHNTQDNGAFLEVIGEGRTDGPIIGKPISLANLDAARCSRTGDPIYPVVYQDVDGNRYKYHASRVIYTAQMESPIAEMNKVGFCAVSRCVNIAQTLMDIIVYKQEKLGSRPHRQIIITKGGLDPSDLQTAFQLAENTMDSQGLSRYAKVVVGGSSAIPEAGLEVLELSSMPDGFDEQTSIVLGMATIALALGTDPRDLFPAMQGGATRADAILQHLKQRGKGPGQIIQATEQQINSKFLPPYLKFEFDFQDDSEDRQKAEIRKIRADARVQDMSTGAMPDRVIREKMLEDGDLTYEQFEYGELTSGRLVNGNDVLSLFWSKDPNIKKYLNLGVEDPLDISGNNPEDMKDRIRDKYENVLEVLANSNSPDEIWEARRCQSALVKLELAYLTGTYTENPAINQQNGESSPAVAVEGRVRTVDAGAPTESDTGNPDHDPMDTSDGEPE